MRATDKKRGLTLDSMSRILRTRPDRREAILVVAHVSLASVETQHAISAEPFIGTFTGNIYIYMVWRELS